MFAPTERETGRINMQAVVRIDIAKGRCVAILADESAHVMEDNIEVLEALRCPVVPAAPGFFRLVHRFGADYGDVEKQPIIAWRIRTPYAPDPITPEEDLLLDLAICEGVQYPDGKVIMTEVGRFEDVNAWLDHAYAERAEWHAKENKDDD